MTDATIDSLLRDDLSRGVCSHACGCINGVGDEADPFIAPNNDYLLFASNRPGGRGGGDIYVSFHLGDDDWSTPRAIEAVNTSGHELCPYVSADGTTLYYTSHPDIYRIDASIIEALRPESRGD